LSLVPSCERIQVNSLESRSLFTGSSIVLIEVGF
jgi:hypothetical protein